MTMIMVTVTAMVIIIIMTRRETVRLNRQRFVMESSLKVTKIPKTRANNVIKIKSPPRIVKIHLGFHTNTLTTLRIAIMIINASLREGTRRIQLSS